MRKRDRVEQRTETARRRRLLRAYRRLRVIRFPDVAPCELEATIMIKPRRSHSMCADGAAACDRRFTRRAFLGASAAGGAALLTGSFTGLLGKTLAAKTPAESDWLEKSIPELQALMARRAHEPRADQGISGAHPRPESFIARSDRNESAGSRHSREARRRTESRKDSRPTPRHPNSRQGQHRHRRHHGDDRRITCTGG